MPERKVWMITGARRGLGVDIVKVALAAGHAVVATGRDESKVAAALVALQNPPVRFAGGVDAMQTFEAKGNALLAQGRANSRVVGFARVQMIPEIPRTQTAAELRATLGSAEALPMGSTLDQRVKWHVAHAKA